MSDDDGRRGHDHDWIMAEAERLKALGETAPRQARDPVNQPIINAWLDAIGETDPRFTEGVAPPAMAQVWTMYGLAAPAAPDDPLHGTMEVLDAAGFTSVLGTNCDQTYQRDLRVGEQVAVTTRLESVVGPKQTGVGEGYFVTTRNIWRVRRRGGRDDALPGAQVQAATGDRRRERPSRRGPDRSVVRPVRNRDTEFFWEGTAHGELRIQRCNACGELRHPPGPVCPACHAMDRGYVVASGRGTVFSFLVTTRRSCRAGSCRVTFALVELEEGVRGSWPTYAATPRTSDRRCRRGRLGPGRRRADPADLGGGPMKGRRCPRGSCRSRRRSSSRRRSRRGTTRTCTTTATSRRRTGPRTSS